VKGLYDYALELLLIYTVSRKKHFEHYRLSLEEGIYIFNNFWYKYFWLNWPSNDSSIFYFTQYPFLRYLAKKEPLKYELK